MATVIWREGVVRCSAIACQKPFSATWPTSHRQTTQQYKNNGQMSTCRARKVPSAHLRVQCSSPCHIRRVDSIRRTAFVVDFFPSWNWHRLSIIAVTHYSKGSAVAEMAAQCCATPAVKRWGTGTVFGKIEEKWALALSLTHKSHNAKKKLESFGYIFVADTVGLA